MVSSLKKLVLFLQMLLLLLFFVTTPAIAQDEEGEEHHSRVGVTKYWTEECFSKCYLVYLECVGKVFPPRRFNNEEMVRLFKNKTLNYHELIEDCSAKYSEIINIENDDERARELNKVNVTSNFDLCVFTQCGAGGYYGSFNVNVVSYKAASGIATKRVDQKYEFYFEMNSV